jgi:hypothetical protein
MKTLTRGTFVAAAFAFAFPCIAQAQAQVRAKADISCTATADKLLYDCTVKLTNFRTGEPLSGVTLMLGADMPSMPGIHNVRPVAGTELGERGTYRARLLLEMHGDWALQLNLSGPLRDRIVKVLRFEGSQVKDIRR